MMFEIGKYYYCPRKTPGPMWNRLMNIVLDGQPRKCIAVYKDWEENALFENMVPRDLDNFNGTWNWHEGDMIECKNYERYQKLKKVYNV